MQVSDKDISVYSESCQSDICEENCLKSVGPIFDMHEVMLDDFFHVLIG